MIRGYHYSSRMLSPNISSFRAIICQTVGKFLYDHRSLQSALGGLAETEVGRGQEHLHESAGDFLQVRVVLRKRGVKRAGDGIVTKAKLDGVRMDEVLAGIGEVA